MQTEREKLLATEKIERLLLKFSVPTTLTLLVNCLYNIVDQIFIGRAEGIPGTAATNIAFPLGVIAAALALLIGDGCAATISLCLGRGEKEEANRIFTVGLRLLFVLGIGLSLLGLVFVEGLARLFGAPPEVLTASVTYLRILLLGLPFSMICMAFTAIIRADGNPKYMMRAMMLGAGLNVILDPIFIFGLGMGVRGAAIATIIGQIVSGILALAYIPRVQLVRLLPKWSWRDWPAVQKICAIGFPSFATQGATAVTQIVMNHMMTQYGAATIYGSEIAVSCYGIMMKIYQIAHAMFVGLASGTQPINGYNFGAKQYGRVRKTYGIAVKISFGISILWFLVFQLGGGVLAQAFVKNEPLYLQFAVRCFHLYMLAFFLYGPPQVTSSFFQAVGKPKMALVVALARQIFFLIPLALLLSTRFGLEGALYAGPIADVGACVLALALGRRELKCLQELETGQVALSERMV